MYIYFHEILLSLFYSNTTVFSLHCINNIVFHIFLKKKINAEMSKIRVIFQVHSGSFYKKNPHRNLSLQKHYVHSGSFHKKKCFHMYSGLSHSNTQTTQCMYVCTNILNFTTAWISPYSHFTTVHSLQRSHNNSFRYEPPNCRILQ